MCFSVLYRPLGSAIREPERLLRPGARSDWLDGLVFLWSSAGFGAIGARLGLGRLKPADRRAMWAVCRGEDRWL